MFKKKDKKKYWEKELPEDATAFQKLWHNKQTHSAMVLGIWLIFIFLLVILINAYAAVNNPNYKKNEENSSKKQIDKKDYSEQKSALLSSNYSYLYTIVSNGEKIVYEGKLNSGIDSGYRSNLNEIIKYKLFDNQIYIIKGNDEELTTTLYEKINPKFISLRNIFMLVSLEKFEVSDEAGIYKYKYENVKYDGINSINVVVITDDKNILKIELVDGENIYNLEYSDIKSLSEN